MRPCLERGCPEYALPGKSRCEEHQAQARKTGARSPGTTAAWRKARQIALDRAGHRCEKCGRTEAQARADGTWLEVHHRDGAGVRAQVHDQAQLQVLCRKPCHLATWRRGERLTLDEWKAQIRSRASGA